MSPEILQIIAQAIIAMGTTGGFVYRWMKGRNERKQTELVTEHKEDMARIEAQKVKAETERDVLRQEHERELARLRADSDKDVLQSENQRQLVTLLQEQGQNSAKLADSIDRLSQTILSGNDRQVDVVNKLQAHINASNIILGKLPDDVAKRMSSAMREAMRNDVEKATDDLAFQLGKKMDELIALVKGQQKTDQALLDKLDGLKDVVDRALPVLQEFVDDCKEEKGTELKVLPKEEEIKEDEQEKSA